MNTMDGHRLFVRLHPKKLRIGTHSISSGTRFAPSYGVAVHCDYEIYAGIDFANRRLHKDTLSGIEPPCRFVNQEQWEAEFVFDQTVTLRWDHTQFQKPDDCQFIYFGVEDDCGNVVYRFDAGPETPEYSLAVSEKKISFRSAYRPKKLVVWPYSKSKGWQRRADFSL